MIKNVWELQPDEIVVFEYEQYPKHRFKWNKDIKQYRPGIGKTLIRELVCIDDPTTQSNGRIMQGPQRAKGMR